MNDSMERMTVRNEWQCGMDESTERMRVQNEREYGMNESTERIMQRMTIWTANSTSGMINVLKGNLEW